MLDKKSRNAFLKSASLIRKTYLNDYLPIYMLSQLKKYQRFSHSWNKWKIISNDNRKIIILSSLANLFAEGNDREIAPLYRNGYNLFTALKSQEQKKTQLTSIVSKWSGIDPFVKYHCANLAKFGKLVPKYVQDRLMNDYPYTNLKTDTAQILRYFEDRKHNFLWTESIYQNFLTKEHFMLAEWLLEPPEIQEKYRLASAQFGLSHPLIKPPKQEIMSKISGNAGFFSFYHQFIDETRKILKDNGQDTDKYLIKQWMKLSNSQKKEFDDQLTFASVRWYLCQVYAPEDRPEPPFHLVQKVQGQAYIPLDDFTKFRLKLIESGMKLLSKKIDERIDINLASAAMYLCDKFPSIFSDELPSGRPMAELAKKLATFTSNQAEVRLAEDLHKNLRKLNELFQQCSSLSEKNSRSLSAFHIFLRQEKKSLFDTKEFIDRWKSMPFNEKEKYISQSRYLKSMLTSARAF